MNIQLPHSVRTPGIITCITQTIDVRELNESQLTRVRNCAERGYVLGTGYVSAILTSLAQLHGLMAPVVARRTYNTIDVHHEVFDKATATYDWAIVEDILNLSDVRQRFYEASKGLHEGNKSTCSGGYLSLVGWVDAPPDTLRKEIVSRLEKVPFFVSSRKTLVEIVETRPCVEAYRKTH